MTLLALMLAQQGDTANAIRQMEWALSVCEPALGEDHRATARVLNGLGRLYAADEETYAQARSLYERALTVYERLLGRDHPQTALVLNDLAALLADMEDHDAALPLLERSLAVHERVYGAGDWRTSFVLVNLADLQSAREAYGAARSADRAGADHPRARLGCLAPGNGKMPAQARGRPGQPPRRRATRGRGWPAWRWSPASPPYRRRSGSSIPRTRRCRVPICIQIKPPSNCTACWEDWRLSWHSRHSPPGNKPNSRPPAS